MYQVEGSFSDPINYLYSWSESLAESIWPCPSVGYYYWVYAMAISRFHFMKWSDSCVHKHRFMNSTTHESWLWIQPQSVKCVNHILCTTYIYYVSAKGFMISLKREIKFVPVYATRPNSCIISISADRDAGAVENGVCDY